MYTFLHSERGIISAATSILTFLLCAIICYFHFWEFFYKKQLKAIAIILYVLLTIPLMILCRYLIQEVVVYYIWGYHNYSSEMREPLRYFLDNIYFSIYYSTFGLVFFFIQLSGHNQEKQNELLLQNNVYTLVYQSSANALPAISKLSELLRYMLYEKEEWVPLDKEVQYLLNYIDLLLLRFNFEPAKKINIDIPKENNFKIAPLTLIPFVENAFKHGDLKDKACPLIIELSVAQNELNFIVVNKKGSFIKDDSSGIGLDNVKKRLSLVYGARQQLKINDAAVLFTIKLTINLNGRFN